MGIGCVRDIEMPVSQMAPRSSDFQLHDHTFAAINEIMQISGSDIHLLTVFDCVVRNNGLTAAQTELGLSQPTISNHITALEERIGVKLCQRGRRGFLLTEKGHMVHRIAKTLLNDLNQHSNHLTALKGSLVGELKIMVVDCIATDESMKLPEAIQQFTELAPSARLSISMGQPQDIMREVANGSHHIGIGAFDNRIGGLQYDDLHGEPHSLYCARHHPLFTVDDTPLDDETVQRHAWAHRGYWSQQRKKATGMNEDDRIVLSIEAQILLVLSGSYLGLLPDHAARSHVVTGRLRKLPNTTSNFICNMQMVSKTGPQPGIIEAFCRIMRAEYARKPET